MMFRSRAAQTTILAAGSALALITVTAGDRAHAEGNLDASYTISFARIPVGEITATAVFGQNEYAISARARAGGVLKALLCMLRRRKSLLLRSCRIAPGVSLGFGSVRSLAFVGQAVTNRIANAT
jgi:hypothetical protein